MSVLTTAATTIAATAVLVLTGPAASAAVDPFGLDPRVAPSRPIYLALGDSLAAGQASVAPTGSAGRSTVLQWRARGFVAQLHQDLQQDLDCREDRPRGADRDGCLRLQLVNMSRTGIPGGPGGVTTATVLQPGDQLDRAVALITERNGNASARDDVEVVSVTVGGNDLFGAAVAACVQSPRPDLTCATALATTFQGFASRYDEILGDLRAAGGEDLVLLTTTYYNPLPFCDLGAADPARATALGNWILEGGTLPGLGTLETGFNDLVRGLSAEHGAVVADTFGTVGAGDFVGGADCVHPDAEGHAKIADVFAEAFRE
ncbi:SGNH/GDSL hydrolase family protein [Cellulomonas aerilata]|uniref:SGNH/GDSL hydrolase family protein n=1 Tax=Cellulomonas aerilata TaxID=515326 RepID=UPI001649ED7C|nr:SGNH/GDSL hydrolase family protein [Cellulomonas aerilata]